ncbi:Solitary outer membrane autotransporter beta-barrel domain [Salinimonas chungwhensis]|uniref:Solitary outer membrane autotransporter beta-barrel domain n=1 Tax=Salinimonas chungwhensis TaxID=265425 RepID=UPI000379F348|nr:Solitary outer membrane autotransporter beta-barrel domain [Salinimonas chungwhensis]
MRKLIFTTLMSLVLTPSLTHANELERQAAISVESAFATASLLSDNDVVKLGFLNFNPNDVIGTSNEALGSSDATSLRSGIDRFNFPLNITSQEGESTTWKLGGRASYVNIEQELFLGADLQNRGDELTDRVISLSLGGGAIHQIDRHWTLSANMNVTWMKYRNRIDYRTDVSEQIKNRFNGLLVNFDVEMLMLEPMISLAYSWQHQDIEFSLSSDFHYLHGFAIDTSNPAHDVEPNEWYVIGGLDVSQPVSFFGADDQVMKYRLSRVELSNLLTQQMGSGHYYEAEIGWVKKRPDYADYIKEYGVGVNFNYGSILKGGTLVLYYTF